MLLDTNFGYKAEAAYWKEEALRLEGKCDELEDLRAVLVEVLEYWNNCYSWHEPSVSMFDRMVDTALAAVKPAPAGGD